MMEDGSILITQNDLLANASDPDGDLISAGMLTADSGTLIDNSDGTWTYQPDQDMNGAVNFNYLVSDEYTYTSDGGGTTSFPSSGTATTATLDVMGVNDAPVVSGPADLGTMLEDGSFLITQDALLSNSSDVDGDLLSAGMLTADSGTLIDNNDGTWTFQPDKDMNGTVNFSYVVSDGAAETSGSAATTSSPGIASMEAPENSRTDNTGVTQNRQDVDGLESGQSQMMDADINQLVQEMSAYAVKDGINLTAADNIRNEDELMTIIADKLKND
ncbi:MAG: cadherin-like domain-containing protein, partial [Desulfobacterales bacterium]|nr:cadherin-like domain-containing protein [Desulfobacterales bacterium]